MNFAVKLKSFFSQAAAVPADAALSPEFFEELSDLLVEGDLGAPEAYSVVELLQERCKKEKITLPDDVRLKLVELLEATLLTPEPLILPEGKLTVILLLGVNGVGKTTTAAKLASLYCHCGAKPVLAAADTFRAAAIEIGRAHV